jgi:hypothetical protein
VLRSEQVLDLAQVPAGVEQHPALRFENLWHATHPIACLASSGVKAPLNSRKPSSSVEPIAFSGDRRRDRNRMTMPAAAMTALAATWQSVLRARHPDCPALVIDVIEVHRRWRPGDVSLARKIERGTPPDDP